jgi:transcriptional regulator with XRE-family HTH domain
MYLSMKEGSKKLQGAFGVVLRDLRTRRGMSQQQLALEAGLDRTYISLLERGQRQPTLTTLFVLATTLQTKPSGIVAAVERRLKDGRSS